MAPPHWARGKSSRLPTTNLPSRPRSQDSQSPGWLFPSLRDSSSTATSSLAPPVFQFGVHSFEAPQQQDEEEEFFDAPQRPEEAGDVFTFRMLHNVTPRPSVEPEETDLSVPGCFPPELDTTTPLPSLAERRADQHRRVVSTPPNFPVELSSSPLPKAEESHLSSRIASVLDFNFFHPPEPSLLTPPTSSPRRRAISDVSAPSELSDNSISSTPYDVRDEETPTGPFFTPVFQGALQKGLGVAKGAVAAMEKFEGSLEPESHLERLLRDAESLSTFHISDTRTIAILGDSGQGKSSLINSLLHYPGIAKTSDLGSACTSVVTEYRQQKEGQTAPILIEVEYLSQDQIEEQLRELVWNYRQILHPDINSDEVSAEDYTRVQRESEKAWSALQAAFGHQTEFNEQFLEEQSGGALDRVTNKLIEWARGISWPHGGGDGLWTSTAESAGECCEKTNAFMQDKLWPFTKIIRVYLNSVLLKTGIVLADLPGLQDTNLARVQATQTYLMKSDYVLIVAKIARVQTDNSVKESILSVLSRHISLEDNFAPTNFHLAVVCTMTEEIDEDAAKREFCGLGKRIEQSVMDQLDSDLDRAKGAGEYLLAKKLKQRRKLLLIDARNQHVTKGLQKKYAPKMTGGTLEVFCVSNKTYKKFSDRGDATMVRASGIPELRRFCHSAVAGARLLEAKNFLQSKIPSMLNSVDLWTTSVPISVSPTVENDIINSRQLDHQVVEDAQAKIVGEIDSSKTKVLESLRECILELLDKRGEHWEDAAEKKCLEWDEWNWTQYNAWCLHNGDHSTRRKKRVNWNGELNWKMRSELAYQWELFEEDIPEIFEAFLQSITGSLRYLESYLEDFDPTLSVGVSLQSPDIVYKYSLIQRTFERDVRYIRSQASEPNETSYMVKEMIPAYRAASQIFGTGKKAKQRAVVQGKITDGTLFACISHKIRGDLEDIINKAFRELLSVSEKMFRRTEDDIIMAIPPAAPAGSRDREVHDHGNAEKESHFKAQLADEVRELKTELAQILNSISSY